jgi:glucans biosynthesis protein C
MRQRVTARGASDAAVPTQAMSISKSSLALNNMRAFVIIIVIAFHSVLAYLGSSRGSAFPFDVSPYEWRAFPIVDSHRWFGFDFFCAWQDVYLMALMFFLSGLFVRPSLVRQGPWRFLGGRLKRLGVPFVFALIIVVPLALYPVYRVTAVDPSLVAYGQHFLALPFWPNGPMWFLWQLLALSILAAGAHRFAPRLVEHLARLSASAASGPGRYFIGLTVAAAVAYVPLALIFTPWAWSERGPFALQFSRPLLYCVLYLAGLGVGARSLDDGLLAPQGMLTQRWPMWLAGALASLLIWMGLTALAMAYTPSAPFVLQVIVNISFAAACVCGCFFAVAACLRFGTAQSRMLDSLAENAFGMYLFHYLFVVWFQYALLDVPLYAIAKATTVVGGTLLLAWAATAAARFIPFGSLLIGAERRLLINAPSSRGTPAFESHYTNEHQTARQTHIAR